MKQFTLKSITNLKFTLDHAHFSKQGLQEGLDYLNSQFTDSIFHYIKKANLTICPDGNDSGFYKFELEAILNDKQVKATSLNSLRDNLVNKLATIFERDESEDIWDPTIRTTSYLQDGKYHLLIQIIKDIPC